MMDSDAPPHSDPFKTVSAAAMHSWLPADLFAGFLAMSSDAVIAVDEEQRIIFFNRGAEQIFGWRASEVGGRPLATLLPPRFQAAHAGHVRGFGAAHGPARTMGERQQISGMRKSGEEFPAEASIQQMNVGGRQIYAAMLRDITPRQRAEDDLREAVSARDDMIGIVSHDLRNPASAVKMLARSIIDEGEALPSSVLERVQIIHQAATQIDGLIQDLLDVTRIEAGRLAVNPKRLSLRSIVEDAVTSLRPLADASQVALETRYAAADCDVLADPERVTQVISNLVGNAIKFTPAGGRTEIDVRMDEHVADVRVWDTGIGIPADQLEHVFDRYYQAPQKTGGRRHGAGLGLPIARGIVEAHGGQIWIESEYGRGTTVRFTLPLADR
ncbi:MAG TPA: PAS domain-containing sensor histidine kinase [Gemmatimonadaceae bacterium]